MTEQENKESLEITINLKYFDRGALTRVRCGIDESCMEPKARNKLAETINKYRDRNKETTG